MGLHLTLHVDVEDEHEAIAIAEQLSAQAIGFSLAGHSTMLTIDQGDRVPVEEE
jgi:hypothetical protein